MRPAILLCILAASAAGCQSQAAAPPESAPAPAPAAAPAPIPVAATLAFEEKLLLSLPEGTDIREFLVAANGNATAYLVRRGGKMTVVSNGKIGDTYDDVSDLRISADGGTVAYLAFQDRKGFVVVNGRKGELFPSVRSLSLSPDGSTVKYVARSEGNTCRMILGERKGEEFDEIEESGGIFSPDGKTVAYRATRGKKYFVVVGERKGAEFDYVGRPALNRDGSRVAYEAKVGPPEKRKSRVIVDGETPKGDFDFVLGPTFTPDGKVLYAANKGGVFTEKSIDGLTMSPPLGGTWIIGVGEEQREAVRDAQQLRGSMIVTPDGKTLAYIARIADQECVVLGDRPGPFFVSIGRIGFSPGGKAIVYVAELAGNADKSRNFRLVIDGNLASEVFRYIENFAMSPDGNAVALKTHAKAGIQVVLGSHRSEIFDIVYDMNFSPDGRKLGFCARKGRDLWWKVMELK
jgi:Tol biopolymer transport system component